MKKLFILFTKKQNPKLFINTTILTLVILVGFHLATWHFFTKSLLSPPFSYYAGDLARLSYQPLSMQLRQKNILGLNKQHYEMSNWKGQKAEIITIGDSFSNGKAEGLNPFYQDYITSEYNLSVLNIKPIHADPKYFTIILSLLKNGLLERMQTKVIFIESIERYAVKRLIRKPNFTHSMSRSNFLLKYSKVPKILQKKEGITFINNGNYKFIRNSFLYSLSKKPYKSSAIYSAELNTSLFTVTADKTLLFYHEDIDNLKNSTPNNLHQSNEHLNQLARMLAKHGITLAFMPAVDKYNLYYPYIKHNNLPESQFFELLRPLKKEYYFIDTKKILDNFLPYEKDIFYADDTHWNYTASKHIIEDSSFKTLISNIFTNRKNN